jgi:hypothetical protein
MPAVAPGQRVRAAPLVHRFRALHTPAACRLHEAPVLDDRRHLIARLIAVLALAMLGACQPPVAQPLSNPREIVARAIVTTAALRTATVHADVEIRTAADLEFQMPARVDGGSMDGVIDLAAGSMSLRGTGRDGADAFALVGLEDEMYMQMGAFSGVEPGRWMAMSMAGGAPAGLFMLGMPAAQPPDYATILGEAMAGTGVRAELAGIEACPSGTCYRVDMVIDRNATWPLASRLLGFDQIPGMNQAPPPGEEMPEVSLVLYVDTAGLYLVALDAAAASDGDSFRARLQLSRPNAPVSIEAPPEHLVDRFEDGLGGVGEPMPAPMPPEPVPAESIPALTP